ncbi:hypothetical protein DSECCO2_599690 [anaerobic digester metagenome]
MVHRRKNRPALLLGIADAKLPFKRRQFLRSHGGILRRKTHHHPQPLRHIYLGKILIGQIKEAHPKHILAHRLTALAQLVRAKLNRLRADIQQAAAGLDQLMDGQAGMSIIEVMGQHMQKPSAYTAAVGFAHAERGGNGIRFFKRHANIPIA